jgi:hypothetical protein
MRAWITEYGLLDRSVPYPGTWAHGLAVAAQSLLFLQDERVQLVDNHALVGQAVFAAVFSDDEGFAYQGFSQPPVRPATTPLARTATGTALAAVLTAARGRTTARPVRFPAASAQDAAAPGCLGWLFGTAPSQQAVVLNLSGADVDLAIGPWFPRARRVDQVWGDPAQLVTGPRSLRQRSGPLRGGRVRLPGHCVTRLS